MKGCKHMRIGYRRILEIDDSRLKPGRNERVVMTAVEGGVESSKQVRVRVIVSRNVSGSEGENMMLTD